MMEAGPVGSVDTVKPAGPALFSCTGLPICVDPFRSVTGPVAGPVPVTLTVAV